MSDKILRQVSLKDRHLANPHSRDVIDYEEELQDFRHGLLKCSTQWPKQYDTCGSPLPLLTADYLADDLESLSGILSRAVTSIVERWWTDPVAKFYERMPLLPHQEKLLKWIAGDGRSFVPPYSSRRGAWRPDFLLSSLDSSSDSKVCSHPTYIQICEINGRFAFNGFFNTAFAHSVWEEWDLAGCGLKSRVDAEKIFSSFKSLIDNRAPMYFLKGTEPGLDIHLAADYLRQCGYNVRFIRPEDLYCKQTSNDIPPTLYCRAKTQNGLYSTEELTLVTQVALELHQRELEALGEETLKALAPICFNDFRTIYLAHDKRMLGIIQQELHSLVHTHKVITADEAEILNNSIVPTFIPGSSELKALLKDFQSGTASKDDFLLKPVGSGKGKGIIYGTDISTEDLVDCLQQLGEASLARSDGRLYVVQRLVKQQKFDVVVPKNNTRSEVMRNHIVGTFLMNDGEYLGIGGWRTSSDRLCAVSHGGAWMCSLIEDRKRNGTQTETHKEYVEKTTTNGLDHSNGSMPPRSPVPHSQNSIFIERLTVSNIKQSQSPTHVKIINTILQETGILILSLQFPDPSSTYLLSLIKALETHHAHNPPLSHSSTIGYFWDVRPQSPPKPLDGKDAETSTGNGTNSFSTAPSPSSTPPLARSETTLPFPWHTDCSYVDSPPRFFALQIIQADRHNGGTLSLLPLPAILTHLSSVDIAVLCKPLYKIKVPLEFANGTEFIIAPLLSQTPTAAGSQYQYRIRFRSDIITPLTDEASLALCALDSILTKTRSGVENDFEKRKIYGVHGREICGREEKKGGRESGEMGLGFDLTADMLPNGSIVLLDNGRWLHARNEIKDPERHLRRVRWDARLF